MTKLGKALIKSLQQALQHERGEIELRKTRVEMTPDGKIERDYGKEDLNKKPDVTDPEDEYTEDGKKKKKKVRSADNVNAIPDSHDKLEPAQKKEAKSYDCDGAIDMNKNAKDRWEDIKKALNSDKAIMDLEEAQEDEEEQDVPPEGGVEEEDIDHAQAAHEEVEDAAGEEAADEYAEENPEMAADDEQGNGDEGSDDEADQAIMQALADEGYSESEIRHIMHGHSPPQVDPLDQAKIDATNSKSEYDSALSQHDLDNRKRLSDLDADHKKRLNDSEYEGAQHKNSMPKLDADHKRRMLDLEYEEASSAKGAQKLDIEHKKRMLDLEYEAAKREKELEIEAKKKEIELKSKIKEEDAYKRQKERDMQRDAAKTSKAEKKGKDSLKKSEEDDDEDEAKKGEKPSWSKSTSGQLFHPEHGYVNVVNSGGKFQIRHADNEGGSRVVSSHGSKDEAKSALLNFMKNPKGMTKIPGGTVGGL